MIVPPERLTEDVMRGILESYITRDGTDYGENELDMEDKVRQLLPQVLNGDVLIVYDEDSESINLIAKDDLAAQ